MALQRVALEAVRAASQDSTGYGFLNKLLQKSHWCALRRPHRIPDLVPKFYPKSQQTKTQRGTLLDTALRVQCDGTIEGTKQLSSPTSSVSPRNALLFLYTRSAVSTHILSRCSCVCPRHTFTRDRLCQSALQQRNSAVKLHYLQTRPSIHHLDYRRAAFG